VLRGGTVAAELHGAELTEERVIAEMLGATSNRKGTRVKRRAPAVKVIRQDAAALAQQTAPTPEPEDVAPTETLVPGIGGRLLSWARRTARSGRSADTR